MKTNRRLLVAFVLVLVGLAARGGAATTVSSRPSAEAWYRSGPLRSLPSQYPANTLHVGASRGAETDRSYLSFGDASSNGPVASAVLTVPVDADAGTTAPEASVVLACVARDAVGDRPAPSAEEAPPADCAGGVVLRFDAATNSLTGDVAALVTPGKAVGLALVPAGDSGSWHIGFDSRRAASPMTATLRVELSDPIPVASPDEAINAPLEQFGEIDAFAPPIGVPALVPPLDAIVDPASPLSEATPDSFGAPLTAVASAPRPASGFQYVAVFGLPLVLLIIGVFLGLGLTRPVQVAR